MRHVVWDWNGTLFDDLTIVVESVNESLLLFGTGPIGEDDYRAHYTRPVERFYERLLGRKVDPAEWARIDTVFHEAYRRRLTRAGLARDAAAALRAVRSAGKTQSLLSMWWHDQLVSFVTPLGVAGFMERVDGNKHDAGGTKADHLRRHLDHLNDAGVPSASVLMVGDTFDDAAAAAAAGVACVLYDGGSHHRSELESVGVPVAPSLIDALRVGGVLSAG